MLLELSELVMAAYNPQACISDLLADFGGFHVQQGGKARRHEAGRRTKLDDLISHRSNLFERAVEVFHQLLSEGVNLTPDWQSKWIGSNL
jgi:hypothetical protein